MYLNLTNLLTTDIQINLTKLAPLDYSSMMGLIIYIRILAQKIIDTFFLNRLFTT